MLHDRTGRLEIFFEVEFAALTLHDRTGRLETYTLGLKAPTFTSRPHRSLRK